MLGGNKRSYALKQTCSEKLISSKILKMSVTILGSYAYKG